MSKPPKTCCSACSVPSQGLRELWDHHGLPDVTAHTQLWKVFGNATAVTGSGDHRPAVFWFVWGYFWQFFGHFCFVFPPSQFLCFLSGSQPPIVCQETPRDLLDCHTHSIPTRKMQVVHAPDSLMLQRHYNLNSKAAPTAALLKNSENMEVSSLPSPHRRKTACAAL